ncbi:MAG: YibE/F family protein [Cyanobacteria bacterium]|nr:YibE/F family protein [Cyanobacteriota bacterium]
MRLLQRLNSYFLGLIIVHAMLIFVSFPAFAGESTYTGEQYATGVVEKITPKLAEQYDDVQVLITNTAHAGEHIRIRNYLNQNPVTDLPLKPGARVLLEVDLTQPTPHAPQASQSKNIWQQAYIADMNRSPVISLLLGLVVLALLLIGGASGLKTLSLMFTVGFWIVNFLIPIGLSGDAIIWMGLFAVIFLIGLGALMYEESPVRIRSIVTACLVGVLSGTTLMQLIITLAPLQGYLGEDSISLLDLYPRLRLNDVMLITSLLINTAICLPLALNAHCLLQGESNPSQDLRLRKIQPITIHQLSTVLLLCMALSIPVLFHWTDVSLVKLVNMQSVSFYVSVILTGVLGGLVTSWWSACRSKPEVL